MRTAEIHTAQRKILRRPPSRRLRVCGKISGGSTVPPAQCRNVLARQLILNKRVSPGCGKVSGLYLRYSGTEEAFIKNSAIGPET